MSAPDLVVFGNLLLDDIVLPEGHTKMAQPGGACLYFSLGAALWGLRVGVVSVLGDDYPESALAEMRRRGIDLGGARPLRRPGLRTWLLYEGRVRRVVHRLDGPAYADVSPVPADLPDDWRAARAFHVAPLPASTQSALIGVLCAQEGALLSLDPFLIITTETLVAGATLAHSVDVFLLSEDELFVPHDRVEPQKALDPLWGGRLRHLLLKQGARGGWLREAAGCRRWATRADEVVDSTGAGDAFAAGVVAGLLRGDELGRCVERGVVTASFALAAWGPAGLLAATSEAASARLAEWF